MFDGPYNVYDFMESNYVTNRLKKSNNVYNSPKYKSQRVRRPPQRVRYNDLMELDYVINRVRKSDILFNGLKYPLLNGSLPINTLKLKKTGFALHNLGIRLLNKL